MIITDNADDHLVHIAKTLLLLRCDRRHLVSSSDFKSFWSMSLHHVGFKVIFITLQFSWSRTLSDTCPPMLASEFSHLTIILQLGGRYQHLPRPRSSKTKIFQGQDLPKPRSSKTKIWLGITVNHLEDMYLHPLSPPLWPNLSSLPDDDDDDEDDVFLQPAHAPLPLHLVLIGDDAVVRAHLLLVDAGTGIVGAVEDRMPSQGGDPLGKCRKAPKQHCAESRSYPCIFFSTRPRSTQPRKSICCQTLSSHFRPSFEVFVHQVRVYFQSIAWMLSTLMVTMTKVAIVDIRSQTHAPVSRQLSEKSKHQTSVSSIYGCSGFDCCFDRCIYGSD